MGGFVRDVGPLLPWYCAILVATCWVVMRLRNGSTLHGIPRLRGYPIIGAVPHLFKYGLAGTLDHLISLSGDGGIAYAWLGSTALVCLCDPSLVRQALSQPDEILDRHGNHNLWTPYSTLYRTLGSFLFYYRGEDARVGRAVLSANLMNSAALASKVGFMSQMASKHVELITSDFGSPASKKDLRRLVNDFAVDMWGEFMFEMKDAHAENDNLMALDEDINRIVIDPIHTVIHGMRSFFTLQREDRRDHIEQEVHGDVCNILSKRLANVSDFEGRGKTVHGLLRKVSTESGGALDGPLNKHAIDLARFNIYGGHHSIGLIVTWVLYELNKQPAQYQKLKNEIRVKFPDGNVNEFNLGQLQSEMPYLDAALNETLRLYPIVYATARVVNQKFTMPGSQGKPVTLTPGMVIFISFYHLHKSEELWGPDAAQFIPERFLGLKGINGQFMPFGFGRRACVGYKFAMMAVKVLLVTLLSKYDLDIWDFSQVKSGAVLEPSKPVEFSTQRI